MFSPKTNTLQHFFMNFGSPTVLKLPLFPLPFLASSSSQAVSCLSQVSPSSPFNQLIFHLSWKDHSAPPTPLIFFSASVETSHFIIITSLLILHLDRQKTQQHHHRSFSSFGSPFLLLLRQPVTVAAVLSFASVHKPLSSQEDQNQVTVVASPSSLLCASCCLLAVLPCFGHFQSSCFLLPLL